MVYKDHKIVDLNNRLVDQDRIIIDLQELVSEKDEVIRGRNMAIQLIQSTIAQQSSRLQDQESLITRLTAKVERAEIELNAFHEQLETNAGEEQKLFAVQLKTIQDNFAELLTKKEDEIVELRQQVAKCEETTALSEAVIDMKRELGPAAATLALNQLHHSRDETSPSADDSSRLQELLREVEELKERLETKEHMLAMSHEELRNVQSELERAHNSVASYNVSRYYSASDISADLNDSLLPCDEDCLANESSVSQTDADIPVIGPEKQVDRTVHIMRPKQTCMLEITTEELQRNLACEDDDHVYVKSQEKEGSLSLLTLTEEAKELQKPDEVLQLTGSLLEANEVELQKLPEAVSVGHDEQVRKEEECREMHESIARLNEDNTLLRQQLDKSEILCEGLRKELAESVEQTEAKEAEVETLRKEISASRDQSAENEKHSHELSGLLEESRSDVVEKESLLAASEQEISRLIQLVSDVKDSQSDTESSVTELQQQLDEQSRKHGEQVENLTREATEVKKLNDEMNALLTEKMRELEELSRENNLLQDSINEYQNSERELTTQIEALKEDKRKDVEKFNADVELVQAEALEKQQRLEGVIQALTEQDADVSASLREIESLTETVSHQRTLLASKDEEIEQQKGRLVELETKIEEQDLEIKNCNQRIVELTESIASDTESMVVLREQLGASELSCEELRNELLKDGDEIAAKDLELMKLQDEIVSVRDELVKKAENCTELTATVASLNQAACELRDQLSQSEFTLEELRTQFTKDVVAKESEIEQIREAFSASREQLMKMEVDWKELSSAVEESRRLRVEKENLLAASEGEVLRLNDLVLALQTSHSQLESSVTELERKSEEELTTSSHQVETLSSEVAEVKKLNDETNSLLSEKTIRFDELSVELALLRETVDKYKSNEQELTTQIEALTEDRAKDVGQFNADLDLIRAEALEKQHQLEIVLQTLSERESSLAQSLREIESLTESVSQFQTLLGSKEEATEVLRSEILQRDEQLETNSTNLDSLRLEVAEKDKQLEGMIQALSDGDTKTAGSLRETESLKETISQLQTSIASKNDEIEKQKCILEETVSDAQNSLHNKDQDIELLKSEASEKGQQLDIVVRTLSENETVIAGNQREIESLAETISELKTSLLSKDEEMEHKNHLVKECEMKLVEQDSELKSCYRKLEEHEMMKGEFVNQLSVQEDMIKSLKDELSSSSSTTDDTLGLLQLLKTETSEKDRKITELHETVASLNESVTVLREQLATSELSCAELRNELTEVKAEIDVKETEIEKLRTVISENSDELAKREELCKEMTASVISLNESSTVLRVQLAESELVCEELRNELSTETEAKEAELKRLQDEISGICDELAKKDESYKQLSSLLEEGNGEKENLMAKYVQEVEELRKQNEETTTLLGRKTTEFNELSQEHELLQDSIDKYKNASEEFTRQIEKLVEDKASDLQKFDADLQLLRDESLQKDRQLEDALSQMELLKMELGGKDEKISQLSDHVEAKDGEMENLRDAFSAVQMELADKEREWSQLQKNSTDQQAELESLRNAIEAKQLQIQSLEDETSTNHAELNRKEEERMELTRCVTDLNETVANLRQQLTESRSSCEELQNELMKHRDQDLESDLLHKDSRDPVVEMENLQASSLEASEQLSGVESSEERVDSNEEMASHVYDVVECVRPRYNIMPQVKLGDMDIAEVMQHWTEFSSLLTKIDVELQQTASLTHHCLTVASEEERPSDTHSTVTSNRPEDSSASSLPDDSSATSLLPMSTLVTMSESIKAIRQCIEHHERKTSTKSTEDIASLQTQLSEKSQRLEERTRELEAARLEIETGVVRFEKLKAKSIAKLKEVSQKHLQALTEKDEEMSELMRKLQQQEMEVVDLKTKLDDMNRCVTDAEECSIGDHNRIEELETLLANKNEQIVAMLEQFGGKDATDNVIDTAVESSLPSADVKDLPPEEMHQRTARTDSPGLSHADTDEDAECRTAATAADADVLTNILLNTGKVLGDLLSVTDSSPVQPTSDDSDCSYVQEYAEQCRKLVEDLQATSKLRESQLLAVTEELEEKKVLATKYAAAAKKLKQQLDKSKQDRSDVSDELRRCQEDIVALKSQISTLEEQCSQKEAALEDLQLSADVGVKENQHLHAEIDSVKEANAQLETELMLRMRELEELESEGENNRRQMELSLNETSENLSQLLREKDEQLSELSAEARNDKAKLIDRQQTLETQTLELETVCAELRNLLDCRDKEAKELAKSHADMKQQLSAELTAAQEMTDGKSLQLGQTISENRDLLKQIDEVENKMHQYASNVEVLKQDVESLQDELVRKNDELKIMSDELADLCSTHRSDLSALHETQHQLSALQEELHEKRAVEIESHQKSCELEARLHTVSEELESERSLLEKLRSESEILAAAVRDKDDELNCLSGQRHAAEDKVKNYEMMIADLQQQLEESLARQSALESADTESRMYQEQIAEMQASLEQKHRELVLLEANNVELSTRLDKASASVQEAVEDAETVMVAEASQLRLVTMTEVSVDTCDLTQTTDEMSALVAQNLELTQLNSQLSAEVTTARNQLADLEMENCTLRNTSALERDALSVEDSAGTTAGIAGGYQPGGAGGYQPGDAGSVAESSTAEFAACRLSELSPVKVNLVTEQVQGTSAWVEPAVSDDLSSLRENYALLESSHARLQEELLAEKQNSTGFTIMERLKEGLEAENEKNLAQIEALTATKQKMLAKLKQLKASNDDLVGKIEDLQQQLETKSSELADVPDMESEITQLSGCLAVLEEEKRNWLSNEDDYKVTMNNLREDLATFERKHEDEMNKRLAAETDKGSLEQQIASVRDELRSKVVDYESQLTTANSEKNSTASCLEQMKSDFTGREEELKRKLADLQMLYEALLSDNESYQQLLQQLTTDNTRLEELLSTRSETVDELRDETKTLRAELDEAKSEKQELEAKYHELEEQLTLQLDSTKAELQDVEKVRQDIDAARKENEALKEEIDGLNWKIQELSEMEQELTELQAEMFEVQSQNGMLKKRLSFVEKEATEKSSTGEECSRLVERLEEEKRKLVEDVEHLESQVNLLRAELDAKPLMAECTDTGVQCDDDRSRRLENELENLREQYLQLETENARFKASDDRPSLINQPTDTENLRVNSYDEKMKSLESEVEELRRQYLVVENSNMELRSVIEGLKSEDVKSPLHEKMVACHTDSTRPVSTDTAERQLRVDQQRQLREDQQLIRHSYTHQVT